MTSVEKFQNMMRVDDRAFAGEVTTPVELVNDMLDKLPVEVFKSSSTTFCDPCFGNGTFIIEIIKRLRKHGHSMENIQRRIYGCEISKRLYNKVRKRLSKYAFDGLYLGNALECSFNDMKFDIVIGNPPYQDNSKGGGQNKIYNQFCKLALEIINATGCLAFVTPTAVTRPSKRFSILNLRGLKVVDFTADDYFDQGVNICYWVVDKTYTGDILINQSSGHYHQRPGEPIQDTSAVSSEFVKIYHALKSIAHKPELRMFRQNTIPGKPALSDTQTPEFNTPLHKIIDGKPVFTSYTKVNVKARNLTKVVFSMSKSIGDASTIISNLDFDQNHVFIEVNNNEQSENVKAFVFSDYFINHCKQWKRVDGYGFNNALKFLPPFDKDVKWDNDKVREFFESFV